MMNTTKEKIQEKISILSLEQQKLIKAFYGIDTLKERDINKLSVIIDNTVYDTEVLLIDALNKINGTTKKMWV